MADRQLYAHNFLIYYFTFGGLRSDDTTPFITAQQEYRSQKSRGLLNIYDTKNDIIIQQWNK